MLEKPSLMTRIVVGKSAGFIIGLAGFLFLPYFLPEADWLIRWGLLLRSRDRHEDAELV